MKNHKYADLFPMGSEAEINHIAESIKTRGLLVPIVTLDGEVLDGRNRLKACELAGVAPVFTEYNGKDPLNDVIDWNLNRRQLSVSQRAMIAEKLADMTAEEAGKNTKFTPIQSAKPTPSTGSANLHSPENIGRNQHLPQKPVLQVPVRPPKTSIQEAGDKLGVSRRIVAEARKVAHESPELAKKVEEGQMTVHAAVKELKLPVRPKKKDDDFPADILGNFIPGNCQPYFDGKPEMEEVVKTLKGIKKTIFSEKQIWQMCSLTRIRPLIEGLINEVSQSMPHCVCTYCRGRVGGCKACHDRGVMSNLEYNMGENKK